MKNKKSILLVVLLLAIGFAAVSTTLLINGNTNINPNQDDFNVYYSDAYVNGTQDKSVIEDNTHISFTTELSTLGEKYVLDYEVTNGSKNYDAELVMECTGDNEYLSVTNEFDDETILKAKDSREGKLTLELTKSNAGEDVNITIECTISANAVERESLGVSNRSEISVEAKDKNNTNLNAKAYEITGSDEEKLLDALVETGYVTDVSEVDALIEVESDEFENLATTTFDVSSIASEGDTVVILHFNEDTSEWEYISEEIVDTNGKVAADFTSYSPVAFVVVKSDGTQKNIYPWKYTDSDSSNSITVGDIITFDKESFRVMSQTTDTVTMLSSYALGTNHRQTTSLTKADYVVKFSEVNGWSQGSEINIQLYEGNAKNYINTYKQYLEDYGMDKNIGINLISFNELGILGCNLTTYKCADSKYASWLVNGQYIATRSASIQYSGHVFSMNMVGEFTNVISTGELGIRPIVTIEKSLLK